MLSLNAVKLKEKIFCEVQTDYPVQLPGHRVKGTVSVNFPHPINMTKICARLLGEAEVNFTSKEHYSYYNRRVYVDETQELWHYSTINNMLDIHYDQNSNTEIVVKGRYAFNFDFSLPSDCVTSFHCPNSPVNIRYVIEFQFYTGTYTTIHEHSLTVLAPIGVRRDTITQKSTHSKLYRFPKDREIYLECSLDCTAFRTTDPINAQIVVTNKWRQSLKYIHMSIVRCISADGYLIDNSNITDTHVVNIDTTGVGLPTHHPKITVGETFTFCPSFNVPALPPSMNVQGLMSASYFLKIAIGRAHNYVLATLKIPITIVTDVLDPECMAAPPAYDEILIDLTPTVPKTTNFPVVVDLLA